MIKLAIYNFCANIIEITTLFFIYKIFSGHILDKIKDNKLGGILIIE
jgi:hypothetical protein